MNAAEPNKIASSCCTVIIVTYNSEKYIDYCIDCLGKQTCSPFQIIVVDTGSKDRGYLQSCQKMSRVPLEIHFAEKDSGFCRGNNVGWQHCAAEAEYVLFLNPDAFLLPTFIEDAIAAMQLADNQNCGALTGQLLGYDIESGRPTGLYDSTGIFHKWWGKWFDRDQGLPIDSNKYQQSEEVDAICGAVYFCRKSALEAVVLRGTEIFDSSFYMYKEDIDLSLRLKQKHWKLLFVPQLQVYHCRGWSRNRKSMAKQVRLISASNEWTLHQRLGSPIGICYSSLKYLMVKYLNA